MSDAKSIIDLFNTASSLALLGLFGYWFFQFATALIKERFTFYERVIDALLDKSK